ncbi:MAG: hypothetical protein ABSB35_41390 [Bryobacteraceae bacterium]|jgi:hypothetical protein
MPREPGSKFFIATELGTHEVGQKRSGAPGQCEIKFTFTSRVESPAITESSDQMSDAFILTMLVINSDRKRA